MANYEIKFKKSVAKDIRGIPNKEVKKILERIDTLAVNPRGEGCVKLSGQERYRVRQGVYRIIYEINDIEVVVLVVKVAHRSQVYKSKLTTP
jgi:mRNA interferase RelE/StbE